MSNPLRPTSSLLSKVGSIVVHAQEIVGVPLDEPCDYEPVMALLRDPEVIEWLRKMDALALLPKKRQP